MISLLIFCMAILEQFLVFPLATALAARHAGSLRGRFRWGMAAYWWIACVGIASLLWTAVVRAANPFFAEIVILVFNFAVRIGAPYLIMRWIFQLSLRKALWPFGAFLMVVVIQFVIALTVVRPLIVEAFRVPTDSMAPTIASGDRITAFKLAKPRRWDLVVYWNQVARRECFVKRLVGFLGSSLSLPTGSYMSTAN
jgi:hypothetical protein